MKAQQKEFADVFSKCFSLAKKIALLSCNWILNCLVCSTAKELIKKQLNHKILNKLKPCSEIPFLFCCDNYTKNESYI